MAKAPALIGGFELPAGPRLPRDRLGRRGRARGTRGDAREALDQARVQAPGARSRDPDDGPHDARGAGHAREGRRALLEGDATRPGRLDRALRSPRSASTRTSSRRAKERLGGSGVKVASVATAFPSGQSPTELKVAETRAVVELGADEVDMVIDRGAFLSGRYSKVYDEIVQREGGLRRRAPQGHPRDGRARHVRQRPPRVAARDRGGRGLHQDVDRQDQPCGDAPGDALHDGGRPRRLRRDGAQDRHQAGRRDPRVEAGRAVPRDALRDARPASG